MSTLQQTDLTGKTIVSPPVWFWIIAVFALLWYLMDMSQFYMRVTATPEAISAMPENQQLFFKAAPSWVNIVFALEVFGGLFGCIALLFKKRLALPLFCVSLVGVLGQTFYIWFLSDHVSQMGMLAIVMPSLAILISVILIVISRIAIKRFWLR